MAPVSITAFHRLAVALRTAGAVGGGYVLAWLSALIVKRLASFDASDASLLAGMIAFLVFPVVTIWCFGSRSLRSMVIGLALPALLLAGLLALISGAGS